MKALWGVLGPYRGWMALTLGLVLVQTLAELGLPTLMASIIDRGVVGGDQSAVWTGGAALLAASLAGALASVAASWTSSRLGAGFGRDLRAAVFRKTTGLSVTQFGRWGAASLITRTTNDVSQVQGFAVMSLRMMAAAPLMAVGGVVLALALDPGLAVVLLAAVPVLGVMIVFVARRGVTLFRLVQEKIDRLNRVLRETLTGVRVIRAFGRGDFDAARFREANLDLADISLKTQKLMAVVMPGMMLAMSLTSIALVWFGGARVEAGDLAIGELMAFLQYAAMILFSLMMLSMLFVIGPRAAVSAARIGEVLEAAEPELRAGTVPEVRAGGLEVEFRDVTFRYPGAEQAALEGVSFRIEPGTTTALIGGTGSGKTTVIQLLARFQDASEGKVLVEGRDVLDWDREALRSRLGLVPQKARLFAGTVAENLRWGRADAGQAELQWALEVAQAAFVAERPEGLDSRVEKNGANLSGGQRQRLSLARALLRRPGLLVLDDSFSALDLKTEAAVRAGLAREGFTALVVAQRVSTVRHADRIVVLDDGRVAGIGTHDQLLAGCAVYREIVASQLQAGGQP